MSQVRPVILAAFAGILTAVAYGGEAVAANNVWLCNFPGFQETTYIYDDQTKEGLTVGNVGESPVFTYVGTDAISFVEPLSSGGVQTTTIGLKTGQAVYSRHALDPGGGLSPSQVVGLCKAAVGNIIRRPG